MSALLTSDLNFHLYFGFLQLLLYVAGHFFLNLSISETDSKLSSSFPAEFKFIEDKVVLGIRKSSSRTRTDMKITTGNKNTPVNKITFKILFNQLFILLDVSSFSETGVGNSCFDFWRDHKT